MNAVPTTGKRRTEPCVVQVLSLASDGRLIMPWSRQSDESHQAFAAFETYRDGVVRGRRSIRRTAAAIGRSRQLLGRWSVRWSWGKRCAYYDRALARLRVARRMAEVEEQAAQAARELEGVRYLAIPTRGRDALDRLLSDGDFLLHAALVLPYEDLAALLGGPLGGVGQKYTETGTETRKCPDPWLVSGLDRSTARNDERGSDP
jgi:hypothetical protein